MDENINNDIKEFDIDFNIVEKEFEDIINEIEFKTEDDKLLCESIIDHIEKNIALGLKNMKIVQLPYIGTLRIDPIKKEIKEHKEAFHIARKHMNKFEYKEYAKDYVNHIREKQEEKDRLNLVMKRIRSNNNEKYKSLYKQLGRSYAEMFVYSISLLTHIPYDKEWEEHYQSLKE